MELSNIGGSVVAPSVGQLTVSHNTGQELVRDFALGFLGQEVANTTWVSSSGQQINAEIVQVQNVQEGAETGGDFAKFVEHTSLITGISYEIVTILAATVWTLFVPLMALGLYLHAKAHALESVPDVLAVRYWLLHADKEKVEEMLKSYEGDSKDHVAKWGHLLETISEEELTKAKEGLLIEWEAKTPTDRVQMVFTVTALIGCIMDVVEKVLESLAHVGGAIVHKIVHIFTYITPVFIAGVVIASAYQAYKDLASSDECVPKLAKMISVAKLILSIALTVVITMTIFMPGINLVVLGIILASTVVNFGLTYLKARTMHEHFEKLQLTEPCTVQVMNALNKKNPEGKVVKAWKERCEKAKLTEREVAA